MAEKKTSKASAGKPEPTHQPGTSKGEEKAKEAGKEPGRRKTGTTGPNAPPVSQRAETPPVESF